MVTNSIAFHDEVEIEDFEFDDERQVYVYPCPCGDQYVLFIPFSITLFINKIRDN